MVFTGSPEIWMAAVSLNASSVQLFYSAARCRRDQSKRDQLANNSRRAAVTEEEGEKAVVKNVPMILEELS